jgi:hypothetical protein
MILTLTGCVSVCIACLIGKRCQKLMKTIQIRDHHRKNIYPAITSNRLHKYVDDVFDCKPISGKYVINHKFASADEGFRHVIVQGQDISRQNPKYDNYTDEISPSSPPTIRDIGPLYTLIMYIFLVQMLEMNL